MLHKVMLPSVQLGTFGALVPTRDLIHMLDSELAFDVVIVSGCIEHRIILPQNDST